MNGDRFTEVALWVLSLVLAIVFFYNGIGKIFGHEAQVMRFEEVGLPLSLMYAVGILELAGGIFLIIPRLAVAGGSILALIMLSSAALHMINDNLLFTIRAIVITGMLIGICILRVRHRPTHKKH